MKCGRHKTGVSSVPLRCIGNMRVIGVHSEGIHKEQPEKSPPQISSLSFRPRASWQKLTRRRGPRCQYGCVAASLPWRSPRRVPLFCNPVGVPYKGPRTQIIGFEGPNATIFMGYLGPQTLLFGSLDP